MLLSTEKLQSRMFGAMSQVLCSEGKVVTHGFLRFSKGGRGEGKGMRGPARRACQRQRCVVLEAKRLWGFQSDIEWGMELRCNSVRN